MWGSVWLVVAVDAVVADVSLLVLIFVLLLVVLLVVSQMSLLA